MITQIPITIDLRSAYPGAIHLIQGENIGRRIMFTIVSGGVAVDLTGKTIVLVGTKPDGSPICLTCVVDSATAGRAYCDIVSGLVSIVGDCTLQLRILTAAITGTATSGTSTSMYDTSKSWTTNAYVGSWLYIYSGTGIGQARRITANTATQLTVSDAWQTNPASGSGYSIMTETGFTMYSKFPDLSSFVPVLKIGGWSNADNTAGDVVFVNAYGTAFLLTGGSSYILDNNGNTCANSAHMQSGSCVLNSASAVSVTFYEAFQGVPVVMLTIRQSGSINSVPRVTAVSATGFSAIMGGSGVSGITVDWLAVYPSDPTI